MTGLDELIRESLQTTASEQAEPFELAIRSMRQGRQIRRRRQVGLSALAATSVVAIVVGSVAIADSVGHRPAVQLVGPAGPAKSQAKTAPKSTAKAHAKANVKADTPQQPWFDAWPKDRVYGTKPSDAFFAQIEGGSETVYASGSMPDGTDFALSLVPSSSQPRSARWDQGWNNVADFGDGDNRPVPDAGYLAFESPTSATAGPDSNGATSQWLIVAGRPGTTSASYSADGVTWQPMDVQDGIAVVKLPAIASRTAQIQLSDASGQYVNGPLFTP